MLEAPVPRIQYSEHDDADFKLTAPKRRTASRFAPDRAAKRGKPSPHHDPRKVAEGRESFKCGHCKSFVGPTVSGGRHRNHCPLCLYSRHVDRGHPGDRLCDCRSLMEPIGLATRRNGEQVIVHRCLGCEVERVCRVAADDHPLIIMRLPLVPHPAEAAAADEELAHEELA
ncbi:MAG: RNHCP domain-containing protein [Thermomicrobiales bacterium]|nr:RNHCP domain-containing protein [Thermomicrobiales bacterium]